MICNKLFCLKKKSIAISRIKIISLFDIHWTRILYYFSHCNKIISGVKIHLYLYDNDRKLVQYFKHVISYATYILHFSINIQRRCYCLIFHYSLLAIITWKTNKSISQIDTSVCKIFLRRSSSYINNLDSTLNWLNFYTVSSNSGTQID